MDAYHFLSIQPIQENQLLHDNPPSMGYGIHQKQRYNGTELLYKIFRGDTKLIRSTCEANKFRYTESHEWNLLWTSSSCKSYLYEGLNEY